MSKEINNKGILLTKKNMRNFIYVLNMFFDQKFHITHTQFNLGFSCLEHCLKNKENFNFNISVVIII